MWISLLLALLTYLASPKGNDSERRRALLTAAAVGGAAYIATEYTDWGRDVSDRFDGAIGVGGDSRPPSDTVTSPTVRKPDGSPSGGVGSFGSWLPGAIGVGAGAAVGASIPPWLLWGGIALAGYLILSR